MTEDELIEKMARAMCDTWGYLWDGETNDEQTAPETCVDIVPGKSLYREAARAALAAIREAGCEVAPREPTEKRLAAAEDPLCGVACGDVALDIAGDAYCDWMDVDPLKGET
jgi:hypothetical protein